MSGDKTVKIVGGAEVQQAILAKELCRRGHEVSMICMNHGQPDRLVLDGTTIFRAHTPDGGIPGVRFFVPRLTSIWAAMRRANAEIYYQRTAAALSAQVVAFASLHGRVSIFAGASDRDFTFDLRHLTHARDKALYRWALRNANHIVTQTEAQRAACQSNYGRQATLIRSCYALTGDSASQGGEIIWVGNLKENKRPELFVELARSLPEHRFKLIGGGDHEMLTALRTLAGQITNISFTDFVPFAEIDRYFDGASILINTSRHEGFPNTFLQAWSRGIPTLSYFDSGSENLRNAVVEDFGQLVRKTRALKQDTELWCESGKQVRLQFELNHSVTNAADMYEEMLLGHNYRTSNR